MNTAQQILDLITPFIEEGSILPRTYAQINDNLVDFVTMEQSGKVVACAGLKNCQEGGMGEIYALAVSKSMQNQGVSDKLLAKVMQKAQKDCFSKVFALSKHNAEWFLKQNFVQMDISELPKNRQKLFDHQRNSSIFFKRVENEN
ncbi:MAG: Amino-acid acetyltransferase [Catillopecten margaritatus gill symbiont]|uniref:Amino-acid acetyltransferase n=1 Tax=Catillopecten margaritatus gill symbiont TaxID=3083288 RepID=A0AAU6PFP8_9GAMM